MSRRGFSLMELVIVIVLIGVMAAFFFPRIGDALQRRSVSSARFAVTSLHAKARATAVQRGRQVSFVRSGNRIVLLARHPVTGVVDTVDRQDLFSRYNVTVTSTRDSLVYDPRGVGLQASSTTIIVTRAGHADTIRITAVGGVYR